VAKAPITYPRTIYTLTRNYNVRKVTLVRPFSQTSTYGGYTARGVFYSERDIFETTKAAIKAGRATLKRRKKALEGSLELITQQMSALDKAEASKGDQATGGSDA
jgi:hypothetical protein